jgi:hypothetical protein
MSITFNTTFTDIIAITTENDIKTLPKLDMLLKEGTIS